MTYFCWHCYGRNSQRGTCAHCGKPVDPPERVDEVDRLIWAMGHPLHDRRLIAASLLRNHPSKRTTDALWRAVDGDDPFLASQALRTLIDLHGVDALAPRLRELAEHGTFLLQTAARRALRGVIS